MGCGMRPILAVFLALVGATSASAQTVQDRYGPPRRPAAPASSLVMASLGRAPAPYGGPMLDWASKGHIQAEVVASPVQPVPTVAAPIPRPAPASMLRAPRAALPANLYDTPAPTVVAARPATPARGSATPRFYSLHREYGRAPDAIPDQPTQPRYVLIGPPDEPATRDGERDGDKAPSSGGMF
jgi:hypothetical protein